MWEGRDMGVTEDLYLLARDLSSGIHVSDVRIGLGYTAVQVESSDVGLAYTFRMEAGHTCTAVKMAGELAGKPVEQHLTLMKETDPISSAVGFATLNALVQRRMPRSIGEDFFGVISLQKREKVGMVGFFAPIISVVKSAGCDLLIFEKNLKRGKGLYSPKEIPGKLPVCSVVIISATTLVNHTFEEIMIHTKGAREVVMLGPSTPMLPEVMGQYGVTLLAGMKIVKPEAVLRIVSEGGGTQRLRGAVKKMVVSCKK